MKKSIISEKHKGFFLKRKDLLFCIGMLLLPTLQFIVFYIVTNINSFALAFQRYEYGSFVGAGWVNFERVFREIAHDTEIITAFKNSFLVYGVKLVVSIPLSILFTFYVFKKFILHGFFKVMMFLPSILSLLTLCLLYRYFCDQAVPELAQKLFGAEIQGLFSNLDTEYFMVMFAFVFFGLGTTMLLYLGAMNGINESVLEASEIDGASNWKQLICVVVPMIFPTVRTFFVYGIASLFADQFNLFSFYGATANPRYQTIGYYFYKLVSESGGEANYPYVAAFGLTLSIVLIPVALLINRLMDKVQQRLL